MKKKEHNDDNDSYENKRPCLNPEHNPPMHLYIPAFEKHIHKCPGCGKTTVMRGSNIYGNIYIGLTILLVFGFCLIGGMVSLVQYNQSRKKVSEKQYREEFKKCLERAYVSGQMDAMKGNYRIMFNETMKRWEWIKSPWDKKNSDGSLTGLGDDEPPALRFPERPEDANN